MENLDLEGIQRKLSMVKKAITAAHVEVHNALEQEFGPVRDGSTTFTVGTNDKARCKALRRAKQALGDIQWNAIGASQWLTIADELCD